MIFRKDLAEKVMAGEKTVTRRLCSENKRSPWYRFGCRYERGKEFTVNPGRGIPNIGRARVTSCERVPIDYLMLDDALAEGFASVTEFMLGFMAINGWSKWNPDAAVWRVEFEVCS
jgi:hypothetical protein